MSLIYRPDIDGLRAQAVLSVIVFHAFPSMLQGGFVGVDIFFVISGYLITSIILVGVETGTFSFRDFYVRRVNRICPALVLVLGTVYLLGWFLLLPFEYEVLSKHLVGGLLFASNFLLLRESGYFDVRAALKPLLHLWSLAIEEQFYVVWPILFVTTLRRARKLVPCLIVLIIAVSFLFNVVTVATAPKIAFYFPLARAWEPMAGGLLSYAIHRRRTQPDRLVQLQSITGLVLLLVGILLIEEDGSFPGYWALVPVLGTLFLISAGPGGIVNRFLLASRTMVFIGKISYPLYLWHWPILSYARILTQGTPDVLVRTTAVVLAAVLAYLTYLFIEKPIRSSRHLPKKAMLTAAAMLGLTLVSITTIQQRGLPKRTTLTGISIAADWQEAMSHSASKCPFKLGTYKDCYLFDGTGDEDVLLIGDSHAGHLVPGIATTKLSNLKFGAMILNGGCPPLLGLERLLKHQPIPIANYGETGVSCAHINEARLGYAIRSSAKVVMLSILATGYGSPDIEGEYRYSFDGKPGPRLQVFASGLRSTIDRLTAAGKFVVLVEDSPSFRRLDVEKCLIDRPFSLWSGPVACSRPETMVRQDNLPISRLYQEARTRDPNVVAVFETLPILCPSRNCAMRLGAIAMYRDPAHLSIAGSEFVMRSFVPRVEAIHSRLRSTFAKSNSGRDHQSSTTLDDL